MATKRTTKSKTVKAKPKPKAAKSKSKAAKPKAAKSKSKAAKPKPSKAKPRFAELGMYLDNVAANQKLGLERSLDVCIDMVRYESHDDYQALRAEAKAVVASGDFDELFALALTKKIQGLEADMLRSRVEEMADDDARYDETFE